MSLESKPTDNLVTVSRYRTVIFQTSVLSSIILAGYLAWCRREYGMVPGYLKDIAHNSTLLVHSLTELATNLPQIRHILH